MKLTGTNRPITYTTQPLLLASTMWFPNNKTRCSRNQQPNNNTTKPLNRVWTSCNQTSHPPATRRKGTGNRVTAVIAWGKRPVPFRTRKLRPTAPMVLHPGGCGRVGHRRTTINVQAPTHMSGPEPFKPPPPPHPPTPPPTRATAPPSITYRALPPNPPSPIHRLPATLHHVSGVSPKPSITYK